MHLLCRFGFHRWDGCRCQRQKCYRLKDDAHQWSGRYCSRCYQQRVHIHVWDGCRCRHCPEMRHIWLHDWPNGTLLDACEYHEREPQAVCERCGLAMRGAPPSALAAEPRDRASEAIGLPV